MDPFRIAGIIFLVIAVAFGIAAAATGGTTVYIGAAIFCGVVGVLLLIFGPALARVFRLVGRTRGPNEPEPFN